MSDLEKSESRCRVSNEAQRATSESGPDWIYWNQWNGIGDPTAAPLPPERLKCLNLNGEAEVVCSYRAQPISVTRSVQKRLSPHRAPRSGPFGGGKACGLPLKVEKPSHAGLR